MTHRRFPGLDASKGLVLACLTITMDNQNALLSIVLVTYNRQRFLIQCLNALEQTVPPGTQCILWNNGSTDNTASTLNTWIHRLKTSGHALTGLLQTVHHTENIGVDAYARAMRLTQGRYLAMMDDDVIELPALWAEKMMMALERIPKLGLVSLDVVQDEKTQGGKPGPAAYERMDYGNGLILDVGPAGGWCCMTTREIYEAVGGIPELGRPYYHHDGVFSQRLRAAGYFTGILVGVQAYHACGEYWSCKLGYKTEFRHKEAQRAIVEGDLARRSWRFREALDCFKKALFLDPTKPGLHQRIADCHFMLEHYEEAEKYLERALAEDPHSDYVLYLQGLKALREGRAQSALEWFQRLVRNHCAGDQASPLLQRVQAYLDSQNSHDS